MSTTRRHFLGGMASLAATATAITWPSRAEAQAPLEMGRILCGFPAGGTTDAAARRLAESLRGLGYARQVLVENKVGAGGRIAFDEMRRQPADGSVMILQPETVVTLQPHVDPKNTTFRFDDGVPVAGCGLVNYGFMVGPMVPASVATLKDFLDWARANPAKASYGSPGAGSPQEFALKLLSKDTGVALTHVPYRGSAPGVQDLLGGQIAAMYSPVGDSLPHRASGRVRLLATSGGRRSRFATDVPTFAEQGFKFMETSEWYGLWLPKGATDAVVARLHAVIKTAIAQPETTEVLTKLAIEADASTPQDFSRAMRDSHAAWPERVRQTGFKLES